MGVKNTAGMDGYEVMTLTNSVRMAGLKRIIDGLSWPLDWFKTTIGVERYDIVTLSNSATV